MGWDGMYADKPRRLRDVAGLLAQSVCDWERDGTTCRCIKRVVRPGHSWELWRREADGRVKQFALCNLWGYRQGMFWTKTIELDCGPCEIDCPVEIVEQIDHDQLVAANRDWGFGPSWLERWAALAPRSKRRQALLARGRLAKEAADA